MTDEEVTRFALPLSEAEHIRAQIAEDEAADGGSQLPLLAAVDSGGSGSRWLSDLTCVATEPRPVPYRSHPGRRRSAAPSHPPRSLQEVHAVERRGHIRPGVDPALQGVGDPLGPIVR